MTNPSTTNERAIARAIRRAQSQRKNEILQVGVLMRTLAGRAYMWGLLSRAGIFTVSTSRDPFDIVYANGQRQEALYQLDLISRHTPNEYVSMMAENSTNPNLEQEDSDGGPDADDTSDHN